MTTSLRSWRCLSRRAFARILLRPEEMAQALAWIGADDGLGDWFGQADQEG